MSPTWDLILTVLASPKNGTLIQVIWNYLVSTTCNSVPKGSETQVPEKARRVWTSSGSWWWTGKPNVLAESDTTDWATERTDWWLIRVGIQQKPTQYCKAIILQLKLIHFLKKKKEWHPCWFWRWEGAIRVRAASRNWNRLEIASPLKLPKRNRPTDSLILVQWHICQIFSIQNCKIIDVCCLKSLNLCPFVTAVIKKTNTSV